MALTYSVRSELILQLTHTPGHPVVPSKQDIGWGTTEIGMLRIWCINGDSFIFVSFSMNSFWNVPRIRKGASRIGQQLIVEMNFSFPLTRVPQAILEDVSLTIGADSKGKSTSMPLGAGQRSGNIILPVSLRSRWIN